MDNIENLAGKTLAAFLVELAERTAGPVTKWLRRQLGTKKAAEQLAADADNRDSETKLKRSIQQELEAHPVLESELRQILGTQVANAGSDSLIIQFQGDNNTVQR